MRALTDIVRLPTAASRQPDNHRYAAQQKAKIVMREETAHRFGFRSPGQREAMKLAQQMRAITQTPALIAVSAILRCLDEETYTKVLHQLAPGALSENEPAQQAFATAKVSRLTVGQQLDLFNAFDELSREAQP
jgi:hypothetical protein